MSRNKKLDCSWPPRGWEQLRYIKNLNGQAIAKDPMLATITGLHYKIEPIPIYNKRDERSYIYHLTIEGWSYSIHNESHEYNVLSFSFQAQEPEERKKRALSKANFIADIKTKSRPVILNQRSAQRAYMAALFMIKKIESGQVPDYDRILRLYKIHPSQRSLYEMDYKRKSPRHSGLAPYCVDKVKSDCL